MMVSVVPLVHQESKASKATRDFLVCPARKEIEVRSVTPEMSVSPDTTANKVKTDRQVCLVCPVKWVHEDSPDREVFLVFLDLQEFLVVKVLLVPRETLVRLEDPELQVKPDPMVLLAHLDRKEF